MKRAHKNFIVEYKGGNRRNADKPTSIWGNLDLKSISEDVENELHSNMRRPAAEIGASSETPQVPAVERQNNDLPPKGQAVALGAERRAELWMRTDSSPAIPEPKRESVPKSTDANTMPVAAVAVAAPRAAASNRLKSTDEKRPRAQAPTSSMSDADTTESNPRKSVGRSAVALPHPSLAVEEERAELQQLEEENRRLRKLLAEKLRAENAFLRRRLA
ncbi:hypothetical protein SB748_25385 [Rhizobium sp. SIMBA_035]